MIRTFIDFDGTISRKDVGDLMFETFGGARCTALVAEYVSGALSATECFRRECEACGEVELQSFNSFLDAQEIDSSFAGFVSFCEERKIGCTILSDGMDYYVARILKNNGLSRVKFFANMLDLLPVDGTSRVRFRPSFPYRDETCERCACCKRNHILTLSADEDIIVYIGEGYSDRCPARYADVVFAKDRLKEFCRAEGIPFVPYRTFGDVTKRLAKMIDRKDAVGGVRLRKRRRAELARSEVYLGG
jgi:2-hydroxy-3-keto-5-methylthiopentenyl-1-phosphate phosphatase